MPCSVSDKSGEWSFTLAGVCDILADLGTTYADDIRRRISDGDLLSAVSVDMPNPNDYKCSDSFGKDYLAYNLLRKSDIDLGVDQKAAAVAAFHESEISCRLINTYGSNPYVFDRAISSTSFGAMFHIAKDLIWQVLGEFRWDDCEDHIGFSSGASTRHPRKTGSPFYKYQGKPDVTPAALQLAQADVLNHPLWTELLLARGCKGPKDFHNLVAGSRADTVPKTWKTFRFICIEPDANMRLQRGIGGSIRRRMKRAKVCGINLDSQLWNQMLAKIGSITGSLATIDLKAASDSIALWLVEALLPRSWYEAIWQTRSHYTFLEGKWVKLEKVSSMGNGFTFELESLIFWALSKAVLIAHNTEDQRLAIYGDDIVIHNSVAEPLIEFLEHVGFTTNKEKTFIKGPFRESCGKHYFYGADVSPFNIKSKVESEDRFYWLVNSYNDWLRRMSIPHTKGAKRIYRRGRKFTKRFCVVPVGYGFDAGIETPIDRARVMYSLRKQQYVFKALRAVRRVHNPTGPTALLFWLSVNRSSEVSKDVLELHKGDAVYQRFNVATSRWG